MGKFHWQNGVFFERTVDASVRVTRGGDFDTDGEEIFTIDRNSWASIVASVSERGEADGRFYDALRFHGEPTDADPKMLTDTAGGGE